MCSDSKTRVEYTSFLKRNESVHKWISFSLLELRVLSMLLIEIVELRTMSHMTKPFVFRIDIELHAQFPSNFYTIRLKYDLSL